MIRDLKSGKITLILVTDLSRLSRNISDFCDLYKELGKYKANFLSIKEQFDTSTPIPVTSVQALVGHADLKTTQAYVRLCASDLVGTTNALMIDSSAVPLLHAATLIPTKLEPASKLMEAITGL